MYYQTMNDTPDLDPLNAQALLLREQLCFALYSASLGMNKVYRQALSGLGVTYPQYLVLLLLWEQDNRTVSQLGEPLFLDSATLTPLLKRMEKQGFIHRQRNPADERQVLIALTDAGRALKAQASAVAAQAMCATQCSPAQVVALRQQLEQLRAHLFAYHP